MVSYFLQMTVECYQAILMQTKVISVMHCPIEDMLADIYDKRPS